MKKTLLLTSLVASMVAIAGTTGSVEGYNENEATFVKGAKPTFVAKKTGVKTEVKVEGTGFSFGGDFKAEDLELGKVTRANYLNHSSVWAKYELPELTKGLNVYVKGTISPKFAEILDYTSVPEDAKLKENINKILGTETDKTKVNKVLVRLAKEKGLSDEAIATISANDDKDTQVTALVNAEKTAIENANKKLKSVDKGNAELEGQVSYKYDVLTFGFNSKTNFPLSNEEYKYENNSYILSSVKDYGAIVKSTHKVFVESEEGKDVFVKGLKDVKASLEIKHNYAKKVKKAGDRVDYVKGNVELAYDGVKDLRIDGKADFTVNVNGPKKLGNIKLCDYNLEDLELGGAVSNIPVDFVHSYNAKLTYTGVKGLTLAVAPFVSHSQLKVKNLLVPALGHTYVLDKDLNSALNDPQLKELKFDNVMYGASLNAQYKMLNDQLTLTGKALLAGDSLFVCGLNVANLGVVSLGANAKYDYKVSDKFTVSPEADAKLDLYIASPLTVPFLTLTPKVSAEYKPTDTLTLKGSVEAPVKFGPTLDGKFGYQQTQLKTSLNLKYEWK